MVVDDYAHHPTELRATLNTAKEMGYKRLIAVHQPFTYSRTKLLFNDFVDVLKIPDITVLTPIMGSREPNDPTITSAKLAAQIPGSVLVNSLEEAAEWVKQNAREGDLVITLGCGDIYKASKMMVAEQRNFRLSQQTARCERVSHRAVFIFSVDTSKGSAPRHGSFPDRCGSALHPAESLPPAPAVPQSGHPPPAAPRCPR